MDEFKQRQRTIWAVGDYPTLAEHLASAGELEANEADDGSLRISQEYLLSIIRL
jgi:hypothetical protein